MNDVTLEIPFSVETDERGGHVKNVPVLHNNGVQTMRGEVFINPAGDMWVISNGTRFPVVGVRLAGHDQAIVRTTANGGQVQLWIPLTAWRVAKAYAMPLREAAAQ